MAITAATLEMTSVFVVLFAIFVFLGFYGVRWRRGNLEQLWDWALAGRRLGAWLAFFLLGADWYTAYSILAVPSAVYALGTFGFFAVAYQAMVFAFAMLVMPKMWTLAHRQGYVTASDFVKDRFGSRALSILVAIIGIVSVLPYIALQIVGMQVVLASMLLGVVGTRTIQEISLVIAFVILAATTYASGLRGVTLGAVFKDIIVWVTLLSMVFVVIPKTGGFENAFVDAAPKYLTLSPSLAFAYSTSMLGVVLSAYLWPHNVNSALSAQDEHKLRIGLSLAVLYAIPLALADLLGVAVLKVPAAMKFLENLPQASRGIYIIPSLAITQFPAWFAGLIMVGAFVGGLVPAAVMAISQGNLIARNIVKEIKPNLTDKREASIAKWAAAFFKFLALGLVFTVPAALAIQFYLVGAIVLLQILPAFFLGLYTRGLRKEALIIGIVVSCITGLWMVLVANKFGPITTTLYPTPVGPMYIGIIGLVLNIVITLVLSAIIPKRIAVKQPA